MSCARCLWKTPDNICRKLEIKINDLTQKCPAETTQQDISQCQICGRVLPVRELEICLPTEDRKIMACRNCAQTISTCNMCANASYCAFNEDISCQEPPQILQTFKHNGGIVQTTIINPKRVEQTCKKCSCFEEETGECMRTYGYCANYTIKEVL